MQVIAGGAAKNDNEWGKTPGDLPKKVERKLSSEFVGEFPNSRRDHSTSLNAQRDERARAQEPKIITKIRQKENRHIVTECKE